MNLPQEGRSVYNPLVTMQPGENTICEIKRHPIGIISVYFASAILLLVVALLAFAVAPHFITSISRSKIVEIGALVFIAVGILDAAFVLIASRIYWGNSWVVTTDSITQITQTSLFDKQSSQLSLGNLEDVTAEQNGILTHIFNYGVIKVETAGERSKFMFLFCPDPNSYAQKILSAREQFEQGRRGQDLQRPYRAEDSYGGNPGQPLPPSANPPYDSGVNVGTES